MKIVKLTHPIGWLKSGHWDYQNHLPKNSNQWGNYQFEINNRITECDYWVIHGNVDQKETVKCPSKNVILITGEEISQLPSYNTSFLDQFGTIITSRNDIKHPNIINQHYICPWSIKKTYSELTATPHVSKNETISAIISNNQNTDGHRKRYAFTKKIKEHFKDTLTWYCKGESSYINDKWDGLANFQYSLAIENSTHFGYFTEKITDCFLARTMPFYFGCPNITEYFPEKSMIIIDIENTQKSIEIIEQAIAENWFDKYQSELEMARKLVLDKYQFIPALTRILDQLATDKSRKKNTIRPEIFFKRNPFIRSVKKIWL
jgi:hypothetical protein